VKDSAAAGYVGLNPETVGGTLGQISKIWIRFGIYSQANCGSEATATPTATVWAQVDESTIGSNFDGVGTARAYYTSQSEASYCVVAKVVNGNNSTLPNDWYTALDSLSAVLTFYKNLGQFVTGGGWIVDPDTHGHGNFGFNARTNKNGPQGQMVYVYRSTWSGQPATYVIKSNALDSLSFSGQTYPIRANLAGRATIQVNSTNGTLLWSEGNGRFCATVKDSGQSSGIGVDDYSLIFTRGGADCTTPTGAYKYVPATLLSGGNVVVHLQ
jgi:hypothetical protein